MSAPDATGDPAASGQETASTLSVWTVLQAVASDIRRQPRWLVPFTVAGLIVGLADWVRESDPIPMLVPEAFQETVSVQYSLVPTGTQRTIRVADALVDLRLPYLVGAVGLELVVLVAVAGAGYLTLRRAMGTSDSRAAVVRYGVLVAVVEFLPQWLGTAHFSFTNLLFGLLAIVLFMILAVRLFLVPGFVVMGCSFRSAVSQSRRQSRGVGWTLAGLVVVLGISSWGLAQIPLAGGFLSMAIVGPVQAIAVGRLIQRPVQTPSG